MTALTNKQRVKVNAALTVIHSNGGDASGVTAHAKRLTALGHPARTAYEIALDTALATSPELGASIQRTIRLIEASDDPTVALYDNALATYNRTGSEAELQALAPMMARDAAALAIKLGEMTQADIASGGLAAALGYEPDQTMIDAAMSPAPANAAPAPAPSDNFSFKSAQAPTANPAAPAHRGSNDWVNGAQGGSPFGAKGYSVPKTGAALARQVGIPLAALKQGEAPPVPFQGG